MCAYSLRTTIEEISTRWPSYRQNKVVDKSQLVHQLVTDEFRKILEDCVNNNSEDIKPNILQYKGSAGQGTVSDAPWIATFDTRNTTSAQYGFYPVFLFSSDLSSLVLSLCIGTTQFTNAYGENKRAREKIKLCSESLRYLILGNSKRPKGMVGRDLDLGARVGTRLHNYEIGSIFNFPTYDTNNVNEEEITEDYISLITFYQSLIENDILPDAEDLIAQDIPQQKIVTKYKRFQPLAKKKKRSSGFNSDNSKEVGDAGELYVYKCEYQKLVNAGRKDLADKIVQHYRNLDFCGWDITSYNEEGEEIYIEVKATSGSSEYGFIMSPNELSKAQMGQNSKKYRVYRVLNALSKEPTVIVFENINELLHSGKIEANPTGYKIEKTVK